MTSDVIIAEHKVPGDKARAPGAVLLRRVSKGEDGSYEYVTSYRNDQTGGLCSGQYFTVWSEDSQEHALAQLKDAVANYAARVKRGY